MTEDIYIIAGNTCEVNVDVEGEYELSCVSVQGMLAITTADSQNDYITYIDSTDSTTQKEKPLITMRSTITETLIPSITKNVCYVNSNDKLMYYKYKITDASPMMRYLLGIKNLPAEPDTVFQARPSLNGPTFFQVVCDKLCGSGTIQVNTYIAGGVFELQGPSYVGDLTHVSFSIRGLYDEDIKIDSDLLWHFQLIKLDGKGKQSNPEIRLKHQYKNQS